MEDRVRNNKGPRKPAAEKKKLGRSWAFTRGSFQGMIQTLFIGQCAEEARLKKREQSGLGRVMTRNSKVISRRNTRERPRDWTCEEFLYNDDETKLRGIQGGEPCTEKPRTVSRTARKFTLCVCPNIKKGQRFRV